MHTSAEDGDGGGVVVGVVSDAAADDLEERAGDVDAAELGVQVVHTLLLWHEPDGTQIGNARSDTYHTLFRVTLVV